GVVAEFVWWSSYNGNHPGAEVQTPLRAGSDELAPVGEPRIRPPPRAVRSRRRGLWNVTRFAGCNERQMHPHLVAIRQVSSIRRNDALENGVLAGIGGKSPLF